MTSDTDFFNYLDSNTGGGTALDLANMPTVPIEDNIPYDVYIEKAKRAYNARNGSMTNNTVPEVSVPQPVEQYAKPAQQPVEPQKFAVWTGSGDPPPGYKVSESCANCEYFSPRGGYDSTNSGLCYKFDFPCASNYLCDEYERSMSCGEYYLADAYTFDYDLSKAKPEALIQLAESLTNGLKQQFAVKGVDINTLDSKLYIFDADSARVAMAFASALTEDKDRKALARVVSRYIPEEVEQLYAELLPEFVTQPLEDKQPKDVALYKFAEATTNSKEAIAECYENLYAKKFGSKDDCYLVESESKETFSELTATVSSAEYVGDTLASAEVTTADAEYEERLRKIAEKRVTSLAKNSNRVITPEDIQIELDRIKAARSSLKDI
jgi:hypothetical protein